MVPLGVVRSMVEARSSLWLRIGALPIETGFSNWKDGGRKRFADDWLRKLYGVARWSAL